MIKRLPNAVNKIKMANATPFIKSPTRHSSFKLARVADSSVDNIMEEAVASNGAMKVRKNSSVFTTLDQIEPNASIRLFSMQCVAVLLHLSNDQSLT